MTETIQKIATGNVMGKRKFLSFILCVVVATGCFIALDKMSEDTFSEIMFWAMLIFFGSNTATHLGQSIAEMRK